jgi:hypothetical protein
MKVKLCWGTNIKDFEKEVNTWIEENQDKVILSMGEAFSHAGRGFGLRIFYTEPNRVFETPPAVPPQISTALNAAIEVLTLISKAHEEGWSRDVAKSALKKISELGG